MGCLVKLEQWCPELYDHAKKRHARMDLVVYVPWVGRTFYLDVSVTHCVAGKGRVNEGGKMRSAEARKHDRYRTIIDGVPVTAARLVPIALSSLGGVGQQARSARDDKAIGTRRALVTGRWCRRLIGRASFLVLSFSRAPIWTPPSEPWQDMAR